MIPIESIIKICHHVYKISIQLLPKKNSNLGRIHHALGNTSQAVAYLQQGLQIAEHLGRREEEARIRHRLGLALWGHGDLEGSQSQLERAATLLETIRREARGSPDYKLSLYDLQTASYQALQVNFYTV